MQAHKRARIPDNRFFSYSRQGAGWALATAFAARHSLTVAASRGARKSDRRVTQQLAKIVPLAVPDAPRQSGASTERPQIASKRILFIGTRLARAGTQVQAVDSAKALRAAGHEAEAWFMYRHEDAFGDDQHVRIFGDAEPRSPLGYVKIFLRMFKAMRVFEPDAVIGFLPLGNAVAGVGGLLAGSAIRVGNQVNPPEAERRPLRWLDGLLGSTPAYTANLAVSEAVRQSYRNYPAAYLNKLRVIYPSVVARPAANSSKAAARAALGLPASAFIVGTVGRIEPQKNQGVLIDAAARVRGLHVAIAGEGGMLDEYRSAARASGAEDRIHFLGSLPTESIGDLLTAADCFAFPSAYEGFGIALIEAMAAGLPSVTSDIAVFREIAAGAAVIVDSTSPDAWVEALTRMRDDAALRSRLAAAAIERAQQFSPERMVSAYEELLNSTRSA